MPSASSELQDLIEVTLKADAAVAAIVGARIYDTAPAGTGRIFPDITFGPSDFLEDDADCITGRVEVFQLDCWVREHGRLKPARALADAVKAALHLKEVELMTNALLEMRVTAVRVMGDPDGITGHGIVTVQAIVEEA